MQRWRMKCWEIRRFALRLLELALVLVRLDHVASVIVNANHGITWMTRDFRASPLLNAKRELAALCGVSRPTLDRMIRHNLNTTPGRTETGLYNVERWKHFVWVHSCPWQVRYPR